jgi:hypothetical protein
VQVKNQAAPDTGGSVRGRDWPALADPNWDGAKSLIENRRFELEFGGSAPKGLGQRGEPKVCVFSKLSSSPPETTGDGAGVLVEWRAGHEVLLRWGEGYGLVT